jgi:multiple sugar transport system substrate-binding protein
MKKLLAFSVFVLVLGSTAHAAEFKAPPLAQFAPETGNYPLEVWSWVPGLAETVKKFEKIYPNIKIKVTNLGGGPNTYTKLLTSIKAGSGGPDVAQIEYGFLPSFIDTGGLSDLAPMGVGKVKNLFVPWTWGQVSPDGKGVYAIPQDSGPFAMIYNKAILDKYKIKVPTTWDEYAVAAENLYKASNGQVQLGNFYSTFAPWFVALVWADGGQLFNRSGDQWSQTLNSPNAKKVLAYWDGLIKKGYIGTLPAFSADYNNAVGAGKIASAMEAAWGPNGYVDNHKAKMSGQWRVADLPQWNKVGKKGSGNWGGSSNVVMKQSKYPKAGLLFSIWLNSSQEAIEANWDISTLFTAASAGLGLPKLNDTTTTTSKFFGGQNVVGFYTKAAKAVNPDFKWAPWFTFSNDNFNKQLDAMVKGKMTSDQALDAWQEESLKFARNEGYNVK